MRRMIARVATLMLIVMVMVMVPATPAAAVVGISAEFCVSETHFFYDITLTDVPQDDNTFSDPALRGTLILNADSNVSDSQGAQFGFEYRVLDLSSPSVFIYTNPFLLVSEFGTAPQRWQLGAFAAPDDLAISSGDGFWTVVFSGSFVNGTEPFDPGNDPVFRVFHQERPGNNIQTFDTVPVTRCEALVTTTQPPVTTTQPPVTTTQPPVTTTQPPVTTTQLPVTTIQPPVTTTQPPVTTTQPPVTTTQPPVTTTQPPVTTTQPPVTTTQPPVTTTQPPVTTTQPPVTTTQPPVTTTQPPVTTTQPPVTTTQPPVTTTQPPVTTIQPPVTTAAPTTTVAPTVAPSSTLPATGPGDAVRVSAPLGIGLVLAGLVALVGAALIGDRRRRQ